MLLYKTPLHSLHRVKEVIEILNSGTWRNSVDTLVMIETNLG